MAPDLFGAFSQYTARLAPAWTAVRVNLRDAGLPQHHAAGILGNFGRYFAEFTGCAGRPERYRRLIGSTDFSILEKLREEGRGVLVVAPHYGNWEIGALAIREHFGPIDVLVRPTGDVGLDAIIRRSRGDNRLIDVTGSMRRLPRALSGAIVAAAIDEPRMEGEEVEFFGRRRFFPAALFRLARRAGAAVVPTLCRREGGRIVLRFADPVESAQETAERFEEWIREDPGQWLALWR